MGLIRHNGSSIVPTTPCVFPIACGIIYPLPPSLPVDCNDSLYAGDQKLVAEVGKLVHTLLDQILDHMKGLGTTIEVRLQALSA